MALSGIREQHGTQWYQGVVWHLVVSGSSMALSGIRE